MASAKRRDPVSLSKQLFEQSYSFEFFQAVRLLESMDPETVNVGTGSDPRNEGIRFSSHVSLAFSPSALKNIRPPVGDEPQIGVSVAFMGLANPTQFGSLPLPYAEKIFDLSRDRNFAYRDFLDLFNHRLISLFYRAWAKYHFPVEYESSRRDQPGMFERALYSLCGIGQPSLTRDLPYDRRALLARAGSFNSGPVPVSALITIIEEYFRVPVRVKQFVASWHPLEPSDCCRLGVKASELGGVILGLSVQVAQNRFQLILGPLDWSQFQDMLPLGNGFRPLVEMVSLAVGPEFDFDIRLQLDPQATPRLRLGVSDDEGVPWLGWSTWLVTDTDNSQPSEVVLDSNSQYCSDNLSAAG